MGLRVTKVPGFATQAANRNGRGGSARRRNRQVRLCAYDRAAYTISIAGFVTTKPVIFEPDKNDRYCICPVSPKLTGLQSFLWQSLLLSATCLYMGSYLVCFKTDKIISEV